MESLNRPITCKDIEAVIQSLPSKKNPKAGWFQCRILLNFKEDLIPILLKLFHIIQTEGTLPNSLYKMTVTLISKPHKDSTNKELQTSLTHEHRCKNTQQNTAKLNPRTHQKIHSP